MSDSSILSVREMIDIAFGETDVNIVNFKLVQTILYILARQLRILERQVSIVIGPSIVPSLSSLSITEVKLHARVHKRKRRLTKPESKGVGVSKDRRGVSKISGVLSEKASKITEKPSEQISRLTTEKSSSDKTKSSTDKTTSSTDKTTTSTGKTTTSTDKTTSSTDKTTSDTTKTSTKLSSSTKTSTAISSSDKTKSTTQDATSSSDKTTTITEKTGTIKSSTDKTLSSSTKTSSDKTKTSTEPSSSLKSSTEQTSTQKSSTEKSSTEKSSTEKSSTDKSSLDKKASDKKTFSKISSQERKGQTNTLLLENIEQMREQEMRVIHQRADSREEAERTPTPMASLDSMEVQYEKLLIVERLPTEEATLRTEHSRDGKGPKLSIVTQDQFEDLAKIVKELQGRFGSVGQADFPDNVQLMKELRKGASLTDAMAALQLSARLEAAEKTLEQMLSLVTDLATRKGIDITSTQDIDKPETKVIFKASVSAVPSKASRKHSTKLTEAPTASQFDQLASTTLVLPEPEELLQEEKPPIKPSTETTDEIMTKKPDWIKIDELDDAMQAVYDSLIKSVTNTTTKAVSNADSALKIATKLEKQLGDALDLGFRMDDLENVVSEYADQINILDTGLSSQMTNYQEQLTQMQHDLESGLESMAEALANIGGDPVAVAELNSNFTNLQMDIDSTNFRQKELNEQQHLLSLDLQGLLKQIELLRESKSDREEVADALRDKAGLGALNGLVTLQQFDAVRGDFEKRIGAAYDKFNNQEIIWQKAIDDLLRELNEKADWVQVASLKDDINNNMNMLRSRMHAMMEIVGEPRSAAVSKKLFRDTNCLSCASPAHMEMVQKSPIPALPAFPNPKDQPKSINEARPEEDGDHGICYPGKPIPHLIDPRAHICQRYCGGSHTVLPNTTSRAPAGMTISPALRKVSTAVGSDGKVYMTDEPILTKKPCLPCNVPKLISPQPSQTFKDTQVPENVKFDSDTTPLDFYTHDGYMMGSRTDSNSMTPPPPAED